MSDKSAIEWTEATWNLWYGCTKVSPGCANCYIERTPPYRMKGLKFDRGAIPLAPKDETVYSVPWRWRRPRRIFVNSLTDTFHKDVPFVALRRLFLTMALAGQHTFQVLTKRPERMLEFFRDVQTEALVAACQGMWSGPEPFVWPLPNVWIGVTAENRRFADERIPLLLKTPAAVRFVSCEPLLGPLDLSRWLPPDSSDPAERFLGAPREPSLDWVIVGGESGGPAARRLVDGPFAIERHHKYLPKPVAHGWVSGIRDQCVEAGVPFFFKQWGGPAPKSGGRELDGRTWNEMPG